MTAALEGGEWSAARPGHTLPRETPGTHFTGGWVGPRAGLDGRKISSPPGFDPGNERKYKTLYIINSQYLSEVKSVGLFNTLRPNSKQSMSYEQ